MIRVLVVIIMFVGATAAAETKRVAVVVGNNAGTAQPPLSYAETDAGKMARVLAELGGVDTGDLFLLQGRSVAALRQTLALASARVAAFQRDPTNRVILIFYFSGHSDGEALELGAERVPFVELRRWLSTTNAEVRLALVDSCKSGGLLRTKGGTQGPAFQIRLTDDLASTGEALLTSSAADELALESREIGGSFFTHHLVSGMRGAADASGDGMVTLSEAYQYAYRHTITTTGATVVGPQHPVYDYRLSGQGELILTELSKPTAMLELPKGFDRVLVIELVRDQVIAEMTSDARPRIAVQPGRFTVRAWRGGRVYAGRITVGARETRAVAWTELSETTAASARAKGSLDAERGFDHVSGFVQGLLGYSSPIAGDQYTSGVASDTVRVGVRGGWSPIERGRVALGLEVGLDWRPVEVESENRQQLRALAGLRLTFVADRYAVFFRAAAGYDHLDLGSSVNDTGYAFEPGFGTSFRHGSLLFGAEVAVPIIWHPEQTGDDYMDGFAGADLQLMLSIGAAL